MEVPIELIVLVPVAIGVLAVRAVGFFMSKLNKHISDYQEWQVSIYEKFGKQEDKLIAAIEKLGEKAVPMTHCEARQREWELRFESFITVTEQQQQSIVTTLTQLISEMREMRKCINLIQSDDNEKC